MKAVNSKSIPSMKRVFSIIALLVIAILVTDVYKFSTGAHGFQSAYNITISVAFAALTLFIGLKVLRAKTLDFLSPFLSTFDQQTFTIQMLVGAYVTLLTLKVGYYGGLIAHEVYGIFK